MPIDDAGFRAAMAHFASGVTVVTTEHEGRAYGMTVASFASLSLHPPLVLVCVERVVKTHDAIAAARKFGVSILSSEQADISSRFASRSDDKFAGLDTDRGSLGVDRAGRLSLRLGPVDRVVGRAVEHDLRAQAAQQRVDRVRIQDRDFFAGEAGIGADEP
jgi:flavin reductase (DIM6/NTAB) family NADH-FMN oxidoreductase RutF